MPLFVLRCFESGAAGYRGVVARTRARLLILSRQEFDAILRQNAAIGISLLKGIARILSLNLRRTSGQLAERMLPVT